MMLLAEVATGIDGVWVWLLSHGIAVASGFLLCLFGIKRVEKWTKTDIDKDGKVG